MIEVAGVLLGAFLLDLALGDPDYPLHPVRLLGHLAAFLERGLRALGLSGRLGGGLFTSAHLAVTLVVSLGLGALARALHPWVFDLWSVFAVYSSIALRGLFDHALPVRQALEAGDLAAAQAAVQRIVGRDATLLDAPGVARAAVESVAEGFVDGFFSPVFWYTAAGFLALVWTLPGGLATLAATEAALLYRAANTLDSMVGYRNERYRRFGQVSARLDDLVNYLPSRLAVLALFAAALLLRLDAAAGLRVWLRDRRRHPSPNSGQTESYAAGALGVRLGGPTAYPHGLVVKGWLGDGTPEVTGLHLDRCCRLVRAAGCLTAASILFVALSAAAGASEAGLVSPAPSQPPHRIVSLAPTLTEDLFAIGAGSLVVGDTDFCDYPEAARTLPKIGGITARTIHMEGLLALRPDLVISMGDGQQPVIDTLRRLGVRVEVVKSDALEDSFQALRRLGELTGHQPEADRRIAEMRRRIAQVRQAVEAIPAEKRPRVFYQIWDKPLMTAGRTSFIGELIELAGGTNIFADLQGDYPQVSAEAVLQRDPEVILAPDHHGARLTAAQLVARPAWQHITAVRSRRYHVIDGDMVSRAGPRLVDALESFARLLHPGLFPPPATAKRPGGRP